LKKQNFKGSDFMYTPEDITKEMEKRKIKGIEIREILNKGYMIKVVTPNSSSGEVFSSFQEFNQAISLFSGDDKKSDEYFFDNLALKLYIVSAEINRLINDCQAQYDRRSILNLAMIKIDEDIASLEQSSLVLIAAGILTPANAPKDFIRGMKKAKRILEEMK